MAWHFGNQIIQGTDMQLSVKVLPKYMASRLFWALLLGSMGAEQLWSGVGQKNAGKIVSGCAFLLLAVFGFLGPLVLGKPVGSVLAIQKDAQLGSRDLRIAIASASLTCMVLGAALKWGFGI